MGTSRSFRADLERCNATLASVYGMSFRTYKLVKAVTQLLGAAAGVYAMSLGAPPLVSFALIATIISGPELIEVLIAQGTPSLQDGDGDD